MSRITLSGNASGTGNFTLASPNSNTDRTLTLPDNTGTVLTTASTLVLPKGGPAFSASRAPSSSQTITTQTFTKVQLTVEDFDTAGAFDSATNYRFTPQVAGYYQMNATITAVATTSLTRQILSIYKNGVQHSRGVDLPFSAAANAVVYASYGDLIYLNGSTDYLELYVYLVGTGTITLTSPGTGEATRMSGFLAGAA
jgi:hypothetical protein